MLTSTSDVVKKIYSLVWRFCVRGNINKPWLTALNHDLIGFALDLALQSQFTACSLQVLLLHRGTLFLLYLA